MATSRNNSGPYILPRRNPKTARPGTFITTRNLSTIQIQPRPTSFLSGPITKSSQPLRVVGRIIDPMTLGSSRQILLAPTSAVLSPAEHFSNLQPQAQAHDDFHRPQARQQRTPMFKLGQEQSEEDELDISEVYRLLDESAGYRAQELGIPRRRERLNNLTPEEKINRRKHKNRIAAQAARDRKKVNTHRLEESLRRALVEIGQLRAEVNLLRGENSRLEAENQTFRFEQERMELDQDNTVIFQRKSKDEQKHYDEHLLAPPRKCQRQFRPQPMLSHQQTVDLKPSFLVRSMERAQEHTQPQQRTDGIGQQDSVGSAASFHEPLQRERESSSASRSSGSGRPKGAEKKVSALACVAKVLMALWLAGKTSNCKKYLTNYSKTSIFQSMLTASATKSLRKELLNRMMRLDPSKLARLSNSRPIAAMAACLRLMRRSPKAKVRLRSPTMSNVSLAGSSAESEEDSSNMELAVVPQLRQL